MESHQQNIWWHKPTSLMIWLIHCDKNCSTMIGIISSFHYCWMKHSMELFEWLILYSVCLLEIIWIQSLEDVFNRAFLLDNCFVSSSWAHLPLTPWRRWIGRYTGRLQHLHYCIFHQCCKHSTCKRANSFALSFLCSDGFLPVWWVDVYWQSQ